MGPADDLIDRVVGAAKIAGDRRRSEIARELRAHLEDFTFAASREGHSPDEIQRMIRARFGDPQEIAREFAHVYRSERILVYTSAFLLSTLAAAAMISVIVSVVQVSMIVGLGLSAPRAFAPQHVTVEGLYLLTTAATYLGLVSLEELFDRHRFWKALATLCGVVTLLFAVLSLTVGHAEALLLAAASGAMVRIVQIACRNTLIRIGAVTGIFAMVGLFTACLQAPNVGAPLGARLAVWMAIGIACHFMTRLATRLDRALLKGLRQA